jgi:hypothetical protein
MRKLSPNFSRSFISIGSIPSGYPPRDSCVSIGAGSSQCLRTSPRARRASDRGCDSAGTHFAFCFGRVTTRRSVRPGWPPYTRRRLPRRRRGRGLVSASARASTGVVHCPQYAIDLHASDHRRIRHRAREDLAAEKERKHDQVPYALNPDAMEEREASPRTRGDGVGVPLAHRHTYPDIIGAVSGAWMHIGDPRARRGTCLRRREARQKLFPCCMVDLLYLS